MDLVLPILENKITALVTAFRFVVFAMLVVGLIAHMSKPHHHGGELVRPLARALALVALVASMNWWFPLVENTALATATYIDPSYDDNPTRAADQLREGTQQNSEGKEWSWRKLNESIYNAMTDAVSWVFIQISALITAPMIILQYILRWLLYLLMPFALACFMIPGGTSIGVRFCQQTLAVLAWPVGFALTNLITLAIWQDFRAAVGANPATLEMGFYAPFLNSAGGLLAALTLLIGTFSTPIVCQMLFAQGYAFTGAHSGPVALGRAASEITSRASMGAQSLSSPKSASAHPAPPPSSHPVTPGL